MESRRGSAVPSKDPTEPDVRYTLLVRVPFARGDFVDPPQVFWDATKDQALWEHISRSSRTSDLDWQALAATFDVPHAFLLQQAAWLYERHLSHVRAQMRRVAPAPAASVSTVVGGLPMKRLGSGGSSRGHSSLSTRQAENIGPRGSVAEGSGPGTPRPTGLSRNPSTATVTQSRHVKAQEVATPPSPRQPVQRPFRTSYGFGAEGRRSSEQAQAQASAVKGTVSPTATSPASTDSDDTSESDGADNAVPTGIRASQIVRRGPAWLKSQKQKLGTVDDESPERGQDEEDDETLPFATATKPAPRTPRPREGSLQKQKQHTIERPQSQRQTSGQSGARASPSKQTATTLQNHQATRSTKPTSPQKNQIPDTDSASSASSLPQHDGASPTPTTGAANTTARANAPTDHKTSTLSPPPSSHRTHLGRLASGASNSRGAAKQEGGSEGTPSMGSSFSDLDDASISQSALEEALLSKMQGTGGGAASRVSNFSTALRSKYLH